MIRPFSISWIIEQNVKLFTDPFWRRLLRVERSGNASPLGKSCDIGLLSSSWK